MCRPVGRDEKKAKGRLPSPECAVRSMDGAPAVAGNALHATDGFILPLAQAFPIGEVAFFRTVLVDMFRGIAHVGTSFRSKGVVAFRRADLPARPGAFIPTITMIYPFSIPGRSRCATAEADPPREAGVRIFAAAS